MRVNNGLKIFCGPEEIPCPICGGVLKVHGTCRRKLRTAEGTELYRLCVMECTVCGRTHRELPEGIVPYKRHDSERIVTIAETPQEEHLQEAETSTWKRIKAWVDWFICYAQKVLAGLRILFPCLKTEFSGRAFAEPLVYFVRLVVNSGNWIQHHSV